MNENKIELKHKDMWTFKYRDIYCEIHHWGVGYMCDGKGMWNSYIYLMKDKVKNFDDLLCKGRKGSYGKNWKYEEIKQDFNFHGGITFYEVIRNEFNGKTIGVKIGNDYGHLYDDEVTWSEEKLLIDLKKVIDCYLDK
jgi:hypothetical protein